MTTFAPQAAPGHWMSAAELAQESGLREDLIARFMPSHGPVPLYSTKQIPLAQFIKKLTDINTPANAIDVAVRDLADPTGAQTHGHRSNGRRGLLGTLGAPALGGIIAGLMLLSLIGGWIAGGLTSSDSKGTSVKSAPVTVTAEAPPPAAATIPEVPDRACAEWASINNRYREQREDWAATDPNIPVSQWSSKQRALTDAVIPSMKDEAAETSRLAQRASAPELRMLLQLAAAYEAAFAEELDSYAPSDHALWAAAIDFGNSATSFCTAMAPR